MRKSRQLGFGLAVALVCVGLIVPSNVLARGGGGGGGGGRGGGGGFGGGFGGGGFRGGGGGFGGGFRGGGFEGGGYQGNWGSGYRGGFGGERVGGFESGNMGSFSRGATMSRTPVSPGWRGGQMHGDRFDRFRRGEFGGFGGWGYWLGDDYWGFGYPWWYGGFPFWYSDLAGADYSNPYYDMNPADYGNYNYGAPIQQVSSEASPEEDPSFAAARDAFSAGNYQQALASINQAVAANPQNQDVHEFHALVLFALGDYQRAAAVAHDVLNAGPGWDWTILQSFYPSVEVYTQQLRALEHYVSEHSDQAAPRFLLGDQYLMLGHWDAADRQFAHVTQLEPRDRLSQNILAGLNRALGKGAASTAAATANSEKGEVTPTSGAGEKPAPLSEQGLAGSWTSRPTPSVTIQLALRPDHTFTWAVNQNGQTQTFTGQYQLQGDDLVLTREDGQKMDGTLTQQESGAFHFQLKNTGPNDPGLEFAK
jgi:tetratricopeptide (TPR) repeat protein